jgi:hypothetical protein
MSKPLKIESFYAFVAEDDEGEGLAAFLGPDGTWIPMVAADMERVESLRDTAQAIATQTDTKIRVIQFQNRAVIEEINP